MDEEDEASKRVEKGWHEPVKRNPPSVPLHIRNLLSELKLLGVVREDAEI